MGKHGLPAGELLRCFFSECERQFRFLEERYSFSFLYGLVEYKNNFKLIKAVPNQDVDVPFQAIVRYEKDTRAIELLYGGEQFQIDAYIYYDPIDRFSFPEILKASRKDVGVPVGDWGVTDSERVKKTTGEMAQVVDQYARILLDPSEKVLSRAKTMREALLEQAVRQRHAEILDVIAEDAATAYRKKDFRKVIELLKPHEPHLKKAELKKLQRAQTFLKSR